LALSGDSYLNIHDGLEDLRAGLLESLPERIFGCQTESKGARVDHVSLTVSQHIFNTYHWVTSLRSLLSAFMESLFNGRNVFIGNVLTFSLINKLAGQIGIGTGGIFIDGFYVSHDSRELTSTTGLLLVEEIE
jgi:hypothetical protein